MSTTRDDKGKKLRAITTGADYGVKAAGATTVGLNSLGLCGLMISNPIILAIAGGVCAIFCCLGGCNEWRKSSSEDREEEKIRKLRKIELDIGEIKDELQQERLSPCRSQRRCSVPSVGIYPSGMTMFAKKETYPEVMSMDEEDEINVIKFKR